MRKHSNIDAVVSENMETRKRKPLSDITNAYNLIPTSTLRKLVYASPGSHSFTKHPISILKSDSNTKKQKLRSDSSNRSDTSIGSSNVSATPRCTTVQFQSPSRGISSIIPQGGLRSKDAANNLRQTNGKSKKERNDALGIVSPIADVKRKDKGKAIAISSCPSPPWTVKEPGPGTHTRTYTKIERGKKIFNSSNCSMENLEETRKDTADNSRPPRTRSEKRKNAAGTFSCPPVLRTKDILKDPDGAGDSETSKSWTDQRPKCKEKRCPKVKSSFELPLDFIEQQRAYFKEVDEFELLELEADEDQSD